METQKVSWLELAHRHNLAQSRVTELIRQHFGQTLFLLREDKEMTLSQLSIQTSLSVRMLTALENGSQPVGSLSVFDILAIASALDSNIDDLLTISVLAGLQPVE